MVCFREENAVKQRTGTSLAGGVLALALFAAAIAGPLEDGRKAFWNTDYVTAMRLLRPLAEGGNAEAQVFLGHMYSEGGMGYSESRGVSLDYTAAAFWFGKAAEQGDCGAQNIMGGWYSLGRGVPTDYVAAYMWYQLAAARCDDELDRNGGIRGRDFIAPYMTPAQIAEAQHLAREWKPTK
jgi:TPR repeat protein